MREEVYKFYPEAKIAEMKTGGNFPYLSRPDEMNMLIQVNKVYCIHSVKVHIRRVNDLTKVNEDSPIQNEPEIKEGKQEVRCSVCYF